MNLVSSGLVPLRRPSMALTILASSLTSGTEWNTFLFGEIYQSIAWLNGQMIQG
ncbi:hypothetical protein DMR_18720 [Solidesulfovibrio magneticus RS-1]|uniref:Uncharacterized protein n=1 Tax=Solidesulfovibrio magneticus (strain ATCC 700980 / DSM 13731 / RS-1) TaxID=573370 RepID=C4XQJ8_SOLM1|nr:hypothetical protein DMR_18720 [Solidesulfovibrio magneticus RS-1]